MARSGLLFTEDSLTEVQRLAKGRNWRAASRGDYHMTSFRSPRMKTPHTFVVLLLCASRLWAQDRPGPMVGESPRTGDFALVQGGRAADLVVDPVDHKVVEVAASDLARDIGVVTGKEPALRHDLTG